MKLVVYTLSGRSGRLVCAQGTVKWFNEKKGYGFITPDDGGEDLFVHHTGIAGSGFKSLVDGASVSYEVAIFARGMSPEPWLVSPGVGVFLDLGYFGNLD
jgi:CspA family cold shock protein